MKPLLHFIVCLTHKHWPRTIEGYENAKLSAYLLYRSEPVKRRVDNCKLCMGYILVKDKV